MSYPVELTPRQAAIIEPLRPAIEQLAAGESVTFRVAGPIGPVRYAIYAYLAAREMKAHFRVRTRQGRIVLERLTMPEVAIADTVKSLSRVEEFVVDELFDCEDTEAALARCRAAVESGKLAPAEAVEAHDEWRRKCAAS